ncbi:uncharacterized protein LOC133881252 [Alnus glutinosa]|uniref:uncharacterized protein LOC133881252 n=1 Tax=Alnus glutinosa TaxID=3517 RepID=UPI002D76E95B|nr:uncharacterized protein LOC133881252 [Alnus glutinosa]
MDLSQLSLISQCEDECSLTHEQVDDVVPIEMDPQNDGNEIVTDKQLKDDSLVNCRSKHKFIDEDKNVEELKEGMLFGSIEELLEHYRNYAKKKYENGDIHYNEPEGSYLPPHFRKLTCSTNLGWMCIKQEIGTFEENGNVSSAPTAERMPLTAVVYSTSTGRL